MGTISQLNQLFNALLIMAVIGLATTRSLTLALMLMFDRYIPTRRRLYQFQRLFAGTLVATIIMMGWFFTIFPLGDVINLMPQLDIVWRIAGWMLITMHVVTVPVMSVMLVWLHRQRYVQFPA